MIRLLSIFLVTLVACSSGYDQVPSPENIQFIPRFDGLLVDGDAADWPESYTPIRLLSDIRGDAPDSADLLARFRLAWNEIGLYFLAEVQDDSIYEDPEKFWNGDGMELFISPSPGSFDIVQISLRPSFDLKDSLLSFNFFDHRKSDSLQSLVPESVFFGSRSSASYTLEGFIPLEMLGMNEVRPGTEMGIQLYINDADREGDTSNFSLPWYPVRDSYRNPYAFHKIRFSESAVPSMPCEIRAVIKDDRSLYIKVLSDKPYGNKQLALHAGNMSRHFNLQKEDEELFTQEWNFPVRKLSPDEDRLQFFWQDSLFFEIDLVVLHRIYDTVAEPNRFEQEIRIFEIIDHFNPVPPNSTLITGSSTIRQWKNIDRDFPELNMINRGFGGSTMEDLNYYAERIILPYNPARIIIYEGDNDIARGSSPSQFIDECLKFIQLCNHHLPGTEIYFMSIKPSPSRMRNWEDMQAANQMLAELTSRYEKVHYMDISTGLLDDSGEPVKDLFEKDLLHLNEKGYEILRDVLNTELIE